MSNKGISVIIVSWNGLALLKQSLDSIIAATNNYPDFSEIIVVDNGSQDRTVDVLQDFYPQVRIVSLKENLGFSRGNNEGVRIAKYNKLFFVNNDVKLPSNFLVILDEEFNKNNDDGSLFSISPQVNYWRDGELTEDVFSTSIAMDVSKGEIVQKFGVDKMRRTVPDTQETVYGTGAALLVDAEKFNSLGGFPEIYSPAYWEDFDLCYHAWKRGWGSLYTAKTIAWHQISATSGGLDNSFKSKLMLRNYFIFNLINFDSKEFLTNFMKKSFYFSLVQLLEGKMEGKVFFQVLITYGPSILKERATRADFYKISDEEIIKRTSIHQKCWESPLVVNYGLLDVYNSLMKD